MTANALEDLRRGWKLRADCVALEFSAHAIARYAERQHREQEPERVYRDLCRMLPVGDVVRDPPPDWTRAHRDHPDTVGFLTFENDVFPLVFRDGAFHAKTSLAFGRSQREDRREAARGRAQASRRKGWRAEGEEEDPRPTGRRAEAAKVGRRGMSPKVLATRDQIELAVGEFQRALLAYDRGELLDEDWLRGTMTGAAIELRLGSIQTPCIERRPKVPTAIERRQRVAIERATTRSC